VRYVLPDSPGMLAAAFVRPQPRFFDPAVAPSFSLALSLAARVTLNVPAAGDAATITATLPAGRAQLRLRLPLVRKPQTVELTAIDDAGRVAADRLEIYPKGWLTLTRAQIDLLGAISSVPKFEAGYSGSGILGCRRLAPGRIDCRLSANVGPCDAIATIMLRRGLILWGSYKCRGGYRVRPLWTRKPRVLRRSDFACHQDDDWCAKHPLARPFAWGTDDEYASLGL
jgi:hypothetical protein